MLATAQCRIKPAPRLSFAHDASLTPAEKGVVLFCDDASPEFFRHRFITTPRFMQSCRRDVYFYRNTIRTPADVFMTLP